MWDLKTNQEITNFSGDNFRDYYTGPNSKYGYCGFDKFEVNLDQGIPDPVPQRVDTISQSKTMGWRCNQGEDILLINASLYLGITW